MQTMFHRYSEQARRSIFHARYDAIASHENQIESHHLLAALLYQQPRLLSAILGSSCKFNELRRELVELKGRKSRLAWHGAPNFRGYLGALGDSVFNGMMGLGLF